MTSPLIFTIHAYLILISHLTANLFPADLILNSMPNSNEDDWSDDDDDMGAAMEMDVLLGVPDGSVETNADIKDAAVSRIGGLPVRALSLVQCTNNVSMQIYLYLAFQGVLAFARSPLFLFPVQGLLGSYGASPAGVVSFRRESHGPCVVCLGLRSLHLSKTGWKVGRVWYKQVMHLKCEQYTGMAWFEV